MPARSASPVLVTVQDTPAGPLSLLTCDDTLVGAGFTSHARSCGRAVVSGASRSAGSRRACRDSGSPVNPAPTSVSPCASRLSGPAGVSSTVTRTGPAERVDMVTPSDWWQGFPGWLLFGGQTIDVGRSGNRC